MVLLGVVVDECFVDWDVFGLLVLEDGGDFLFVFDFE